MLKEVVVVVAVAVALTKAPVEALREGGEEAAVAVLNPVLGVCVSVPPAGKKCHINRVSPVLK